MESGDSTVPAPSTFGKALILLGCLLAVFVFVCAVVVTLFSLGILVEGKSPGGSQLRWFDYLGLIGGVLWLWTSCAALIALAHLLRICGRLRWCRVLAGYLCLLFPFGTVYGVLVFIYLGTQKDWLHP